MYLSTVLNGTKTSTSFHWCLRAAPAGFSTASKCGKEDKWLKNGRVAYLCHNFKQCPLSGVKDTIYGKSLAILKTQLWGSLQTDYLIKMSFNHLRLLLNTCCSLEPCHTSQAMRGKRGWYRLIYCRGCGWGDGSVVQSIYCPHQGPKFSPAPGELILSSGLFECRHT